MEVHDEATSNHSSKFLQHHKLSVLQRMGLGSNLLGQVQDTLRPRHGLLGDWMLEIQDRYRPARTVAIQFATHCDVNLRGFVSFLMSQTDLLVHSSNGELSRAKHDMQCLRLVPSKRNAPMASRKLYCIPSSSILLNVSKFCFCLQNKYSSRRGGWLVGKVHDFRHPFCRWAACVLSPL